jgi:DNA-binding CsgD family transcriptional regulator
MVAFEDIRGAMVFMAEKYVRRFPEYEIDELVNEFWVSPHFQSMPARGMIWKACCWAFWAYHYRQRGRKMTPQRIPTSVVSLTDLRQDQCGALVGRHGNNGRFEARDFIHERSKRLRQRERRIIARKLRGDTLKQIGKRNKYSRARAGYEWMAVKEKLATSATTIRTEWQ